MALPPLATVEELAAHMDAPVDSLPANAAEMLANVSATVRRLAGGQHITRGTTTAELYPVDGRVILPQSPVVSVSEVEADGKTLAPTEYTRRRGLIFVSPYTDTVRVTYTHGFAEIPGDLKRIILDSSSRALDGSGGATQMNVGSIQLMYSQETTGPSFADIEKDIVRTYRGGSL